jgi:hypothetical protein
MKILRKLLNFVKKAPRKGAFYNSTEFELENLICGIGKSKIENRKIIIEDYPFLPSFVNYKNHIEASEIDEICYKSYPPLLKIKNELIFIGKEKQEELKQFAERNNIQIFTTSGNWDMLLEPYVDTEYTEENNSRIYKRLNENGITNSEIEKIRTEVEKQMLKYNFDTMLWDWVNLGLLDVLSAMRVKYNKAEFEEFYFRAMEIELRK